LQEETLLSKLLHHNPFLTHLDLSGNTRLPDRLLHCALTGSCAFLQTLNLSGCELLKPGYVGTCCPGLRDLNVAGTAAGDDDVAQLSAGLSELTRLVLNGCRKVGAVTFKAFLMRFHTEVAKGKRCDLPQELVNANSKCGAQWNSRFVVGVLTAAGDDVEVLAAELPELTKLLNGCRKVGAVASTVLSCNCVTVFNRVTG
jgi:hypothetical protein